MSEEGRSATEHAASVHQEHSHKHSRHALADVEHQCRRSCALLACAKHVGSADVARPDLAQIPDPCCFRQQQAKGNGATQTALQKTLTWRGPKSRRDTMTKR